MITGVIIWGIGIFCIVPIKVRNFTESLRSFFFSFLCSLSQFHLQFTIKLSKVEADQVI